MARRRSSPFERLLLRFVAVLVCVALLWNAASEGEWSAFFWMLFGLLLVFWFWVLFLIRTTCDVENVTNHRPCSRNARGLLRACDLQRHKQIKNSAIAARIGLRAWAARARRVWSDHARAPTVEPVPEASTRPALSGEGKLCRSSYEAVTLTCSVTSTVAGVASAVVTVFG